MLQVSAAFRQEGPRSRAKSSSKTAALRETWACWDQSAGWRMNGINHRVPGSIFDVDAQVPERNAGTDFGMERYSPFVPPKTHGDHLTVVQ